MDNLVNISIVIPVYNTSDKLDYCLQSIISQDYCDFEVVIINDGSTDLSKEICDSYVNRDKRFRVFHTINQGVSAARNLGISKSMGIYICFIDSDDYIESNYLSYLVEGFQKKNVELSICGYFIETNSELKDCSNYPYMDMDRTELINSIFSFKGPRAYLWNRLFIRKIILENDIRFDSNIYYGEDNLFIFKYIQHINKAYYLNKPLYHYIINQESATNSRIEAKRFNEKWLSEFYVYEIMENEYFHNNVTDIFYERQAIVYLNLFILMSKHSYYDKIIFNRIKQSISRNFYKLITHNKLNKSKRLLVLFIVISSKLSYLVVKLMYLKCLNIKTNKAI